MTLANQPSLAPTRKWWAALVAGAAVNAAYGALDVAWPDHPFTPYKADLIGWGTVMVMSFAAYMTRNRA